jgi:hypothetical protein
MRVMRLLLLIAILLGSVVSCGVVPKTDAPCTSGFKNGTNGKLLDADLVAAWQRAQFTISNGFWVINALSCDNRIHPNETPPCQYEPADSRALSEQPNCLSVSGHQGPI